MPILLSLVIPAKDKNDPKLAELLRSIEAQDFPKDQMEVLVITEGTSESAKAIGIRQAKGEIIGILASDNELTFNSFLSDSIKHFPVIDASWPLRYHYSKSDDVLNRYFALIGGNDVLCYHMNKNDRYDFLQDISGEDFSNVPGPISNRYSSIGDNGFFVKKELIEKTDLDNYYHIDNAWEAVNGKKASGIQCSIWHKTGGNIFSFFAKRYRYGLQHAFNKNRRWHLVDFRQPRDIWKLALFILFSLTLLEPLSLSIRGYLKIRDKAWFMHPLVCLVTVLLYAVLVTHLIARRLKSRLLSALTVAQRA